MLDKIYHMLELFLSTPSARRATAAASALQRTAAYFYPRPPRGGRQGDIERITEAAAISIHALREEGDCCCICIAENCCIFLSTPSARRATGRH